MRIGINIDQLFYKVAGGTGRYTYNLVKSLADVDKKNQYLLFHSRSKDKDLSPADDLTRGANFELKSLLLPRPLLYFFWNRARWFSADLLFGKLDLLHAPTFAIPAKGSSKLVVTVHDLAFMKFPEFYTPRSLKFHERAARIAAEEADLLIAVSHSTKQDIVSLLSVNEKRIRVIHEGVQINTELFDKKEEVLSNYGIAKKYILCVGTLEPRKNLIRLLKAFAKLKRETGFEHRLVLVGPRGWLFEEILLECRRKEFEEDLIMTGPVPDAELSVLMSQADVFVYPSLYEGFGLPPLEAMACGTPVIVSNVSSLPEVVGEAGILIDPYDVDEMVSAMVDLLEKEDLRTGLAAKGKERAKLFSWDKAARENLDAYLSVVN